MRTTNWYKFFRFVEIQYSENLLRQLKKEMGSDTSDFVMGEILPKSDYDGIDENIDDDIDDDIDEMNVYTEDNVYILRITEDNFAGKRLFWFSVPRNPSA